MRKKSRCYFTAAGSIVLKKGGYRKIQTETEKD